jgi:hypothetical protein
MRETYLGEMRVRVVGLVGPDADVGQVIDLIFLRGDLHPAVRRRIQGPRASNGHPRSAHLVPLALAERICDGLIGSIRP